MDIKEYQQVWSISFLIRKTESGMISIGNEKLAQELHKPVITNFEKRKVYARFREKVWTADLAEIKPLGSKNKNDKYVDVFIKYARIKPVKDKKVIRILIDFIEIVSESNCKPNKLWIDQGR